MKALLRLAADADPDSRTIPLAVTQARNLPEADLDGETPVFTHLYLPTKGDALNAVFGVDLKTPSAQTPGIFLSHPLGELTVTKKDDLREVMIVAVPPWMEDSVKVFSRKGHTEEYTVLDIEPPEESHLVE